jgi:hypothetical protein
MKEPAINLAKKTGAENPFFELFSCAHGQHRYCYRFSFWPTQLSSKLAGRIASKAGPWQV